MAKNEIVENIMVAGLGGVISAIMSAATATAVTPQGLVWAFVTGVFVVSASLLVGRLVGPWLARKL